MEIAYRGLNDAKLQFLPTGVYPKFYAILQQSTVLFAILETLQVKEKWHKVIALGVTGKFL